MQIQTRIVFLWLLIVLCYFIHGYYHLAELFFGADIKVPGATGKVPVSAHLFSVLIEIFPLCFAVITMYATKKWFIWVSFIFSVLLALLNLVHLGSTVIKEWNEIRQVVLLAFILAVNVLLVMELNKKIKQSKTISDPN